MNREQKLIKKGVKILQNIASNRIKGLQSGWEKNIRSQPPLNYHTPRMQLMSMATFAARNTSPISAATILSMEPSRFYQNLSIMNKKSVEYHTIVNFLRSKYNSLNSNDPLKLNYPSFSNNINVLRGLHRTLKNRHNKQMKVHSITNYARKQSNLVNLTNLLVETLLETSLILLNR